MRYCVEMTDSSPGGQDGQSRRIAVVLLSLVIVLTIIALFIQKATVDRIGFGPATIDFNPPTASPSASTAPSMTPRGTFVSPTDRQEVRGNSLPVEGTVEGISSRTTLLCIVKNELGDYYPKEVQVVNGRWTADVGTGPESIDRRFTFTLILATATQSADDELRRLREANPDDYYTNGIPNLLDGIEPLATIVIFRTS